MVHTRLSEAAHNQIYARKSNNRQDNTGLMLHGFSFLSHVSPTSYFTYSISSVRSSSPTAPTCRDTCAESLPQCSLFHTSSCMAPFEAVNSALGMNTTTKGDGILQFCTLVSGGALQMSMHVLGHGFSPTCIYGSSCLGQHDCFGDSTKQQTSTTVTFCK